MPCFEGGLLDLGMRATHIKVFGMLNSFGPELEVETRVFEKRGSFAVEGLAKPFCRTVHLGRVWLGKFQVDSVLKQEGP